MNSSYLVSNTPEGWKQHDFYQKYLNYDSGINVGANLAGAATGVGKGLGGAVTDTLALGNNLIADFSGTSSQIANGTLQGISQPDQLWKAYTEARDGAKTQALLYRLQGDPAAANAVEMQWETEFALNFVALSKAGKLGAIGKVAAADAAEVKSLTQDQKFYADGEMIGQSIHPFSTKGLIVDRPQDFSVGRDMMNEYIRMGVGVDEAKLKTIGLINSGSTLPVRKEIGESLYKVISRDTIEKYGAPSKTTEYWMTKSQLNEFENNSRELAAKMGLPQQSQSHVYDVFEMRPNSIATVFESKVASTRQGGMWHGGGGIQMLVPNRNQFGVPIKIGSIEVR